MGLNQNGQKPIYPLFFFSLPPPYQLYRERSFPFFLSEMVSEEAKDPLKEVDWKTIGTDPKNESDPGTTAKKRLPKRIRQIPDYYFLPRKSLPSAIAFYGSFIVAGVGAGMLLEGYINKKVKEDGGVIWEFGK